MSEGTLMHFCIHLVDRLHHSSIKSLLSVSTVPSLHINYSFPEPLASYLQLQHLLFIYFNCAPWQIMVSTNQIIHR